MASRAVDLLITYRIMKLLVTPFEKQEAFKYGIIDKNGKVLRPFRTIIKTKEKQSYTILHRFVFNLKRILGKVGLGGKLGTFAVALATLIREHKEFEEHQRLIESAIIKYLKQENLYGELLQEEGDIVGYVPLTDEPVNRCFGIDCYQIGNTIVEEKEYAKYKV
tara:strand:+ start:115 stop:606 length:492 start_codon:yes stop_codon:yes gene_type:complete